MARSGHLRDWSLRRGWDVEHNQCQRGIQKVAEMRRPGWRASACAALLAVSACGGGSSSSTTSTTVEPATSTTAAPTTTTADPAVADLAAIEEMYRAQSAGWKTSIDEGLRVRAETAWPAGAWTPQMIWCAADGYTWEQTVQADRDDRRVLEFSVEPGSLEPTPGWVVPPDGRNPSRGQVPPGRIYIMRLAISDSVFGVSSDELHAVVGPDGTARHFPSGC